MRYHDHEIVKAVLNYRIEIKLDNNSKVVMTGISPDKATVEKIIKLLAEETPA